MGDTPGASSASAEPRLVPDHRCTGPGTASSLSCGAYQTSLYL